MQRLLSKKDPTSGLIRYPEWLGYWPAIVTFLVFAWIEIASVAPADPPRLAVLVCLYWAGTFVALFLFGEWAWLGRGEVFSVFFRLVGRLSPFVASPDGPPLRFPGADLLAREILPLSGALFVLLTLSSVTFDGISHTFWWLSRIGINPLEFPGRSAVEVANSLGLLAAWFVLTAVFLGTVCLGAHLVGCGGSWLTMATRYAPTIIPISLAYHFAHYLTALLINGQDAVLAFNDPFGHGSDLFGLGDFRVSMSLVNDYRSVAMIFSLQSGAIVVGHVLAVVLAHAVALRWHASHRAALLSELPLAAFMVAYTLLGLWLLSTPVAS
jgi:hypothetical protein